MAASVVSHILSDPTVFSSWPHYEGKDSHTRCRLMVFMDEGTLPRDLFHHVFYPFLSKKIWLKGHQSTYKHYKKFVLGTEYLDLCPLVFPDLD